MKISKQGLDKRFNENSVSFLQQIFLRFFERQSIMTLSKLSIASTYQFRSMRVMDGTSFKLPPGLEEVFPGTTGAGVKNQLDFDYLSGRILYMELQPGKAGDTPSGVNRLASVQKDDLILQDLGYFKCDIFREIVKKQAFYISRARVDTMIYVDSPTPVYGKNGELIKKYAYMRIYLEEEVKTMKRGEIRDFPSVYIGKYQRMPSRLLIYRMTIEEQKRQEERIDRRKQTKSGNIKKKSRELSDISIYLTNLSPEVPALEIRDLYRYRWQIELIFKSWKSDLNLAHYRNMKLERWLCHLYAELITLLISVLLTYQLRYYFWKEKRMILSEGIAIREVSERIWHLWQARASPKWKKEIEDILDTLARNGRKNVKEPGPIGWLI